jgi:hypothetical protein
MAPVHHAARRHGGRVAARGARAAAEGADDRRAGHWQYSCTAYLWPVVPVRAPLSQRSRNIRVKRAPGACLVSLMFSLAYDLRGRGDGIAVSAVVSTVGFP